MKTTDEVFSEVLKLMAQISYPPESQFIKSTTNEEFMLADLARSGLKPHHMGAYTHPMVALKPGASAGYVIPYFGLDGDVLAKNGQLYMFRIRMQFPEFSRESRYTQPSAEQLARHGLPPFIPYIHPLTWQMHNQYLVITEGEKKAVAIIKELGLPTLGIGGCQMWRSPDGSGTVHPWILEYINRRKITEVLIVPDGDVHRYDICNAYGTFVHALSESRYD